MFAKRCGVLVLAFGLMLALWPMVADAQKKGKDKEDDTPAKGMDKEADAVGDDIADVIGAYKLAEFGRKNKAPEALITAGSLMRGFAKVKLDKITEKVDIEVEKGSKDEPLDKVAKNPDYEEEANALFDEAQAMAATLGVNVDKLVKLAKERPNTRGVIGGARTVHRHIGSHQTQTLHIQFETNRPMALGFHSSFPMHVEIVRHDNDHVWARGTTMHAFHQGTVPSANRKGRAHVTVRVHNQSRQHGSFQVFVR
jgi:hypothetical protein